MVVTGFPTAAPMVLEYQQPKMFICRFISIIRETKIFQENGS